MKTIALYSVTALVAAAIVAAQWFLVIPMDSFTVTTDNYKEFEYGFPFRIIDASPHLGIATPPAQVALRMGANFLVFSLAGVALVRVTRKWRQLR